MIPLLCALWSAPAFAEDEAPTAIPVGETGEAPEATEIEPERKAKDLNTAPTGRPRKGSQLQATESAGVSATKLQSLRDYQNGYLSIRSESELRGGGTRVVQSWHGPRRFGWHTTTVVNEPIYTTRTWGVYQGPYRLSTPEIYGAIGQHGQQDALQGELARLERKASIFYTVGFVGVASTVGGIVTQAFATTQTTADVGGWMTLGGVGAMLTGFIGGSFPSAKASDLRYYPATTFDPRALQRDLDAANDRLRVELGLTPAEVLRLEGMSTQNRRRGANVGIGGSF